LSASYEHDADTYIACNHLILLGDTFHGWIFLEAIIFWLKINLSKKINVHEIQVSGQIAIIFYLNM